MIPDKFKGRIQPWRDMIVKNLLDQILWWLEIFWQLFESPVCWGIKGVICLGAVKKAYQVLVLINILSKNPGIIGL